MQLTRTQMRAFAPRALAAAAALYALGSAGAAHAIATDIQSYVCSKLDDFSATMSVVNVNERALSKISKDAVLIYKFGTVQMRYKEPDMVRIEGNAQGTHGVFVLNGPSQTVSLNGVKIRRNFANAPGKRKSLMDVGLISEYYLSYTNARFLREGSVDGVPCAVFDMSYKDRHDTSHHIVYVDPKTRVVRKRESYSQDGKLQAIYYFKDVKEVKPGVWFPTLIEAQNTDRVVAGTTAYKDIKVNIGLPDSLFRM